MKAVFLDYASLDQADLDFSRLQAVFDQWMIYPSSMPEQVAERIQDAEVVITNKVMLNAEMLQSHPQLKLILISATGTNNVDLVQAKAQGIVVCNCQAYGTSAVAQHTLMLMLALSTSVISYQTAVKQGQWNKSTQFCLLDFPIVELSGKTLGIIGYGVLGQAVAKLAEAFGMQVLVGALPSRLQSADRIPFKDLIGQVDYLSLHCPLSDETRDVIDASVFDAMKKNAFLINCARGGIVNEQALVEALKQGKIAGAATDVLSVEPPKQGNILLDALANNEVSNLIITPHSAWGSVDARQRIVDQMLENVEAFNQGSPIRQVS